MRGNHFTMQIKGSKPTILELGEQLAWVGAAVRCSPSDTPTIFSSRPMVVQVPYRDIKGKMGDKSIAFKFEFDLQPLEYSAGSGGCWQNMFLNPVVVPGYPIARRPAETQGLEMPLPMMAALIRTRWVDTFHEQYIIKGYSSMLVLVDYVAGLALWHHFYNKDGAPISYFDHNIEFPGNMSISQLRGCRHVIGWCSQARTYAGKFPKDKTLSEIHTSDVVKTNIGCAY